jgi:hypothetical protein
MLKVWKGTYPKAEVSSTEKELLEEQVKDGTIKANINCD